MGPDPIKQALCWKNRLAIITPEITDEDICPWGWRPHSPPRTPLRINVGLRHSARFPRPTLIEMGGSGGAVCDLHFSKVSSSSACVSESWPIWAAEDPDFELHLMIYKHHQDSGSVEEIRCWPRNHRLYFLCDDQKNVPEKLVFHKKYWCIVQIYNMFLKYFALKKQFISHYFYS